MHWEIAFQPCKHFDKILIENNQYKEGPIVKLSEALFWDNEARARNIYKKYNVLP